MIPFLGALLQCTESSLFHHTHVKPFFPMWVPPSSAGAELVRDPTKSEVRQNRLIQGPAHSLSCFEGG